MDIEVTYEDYSIGDRVIPNTNCYIFSEFPYSKLREATGIVTGIDHPHELPITINWDHSDFGTVNHSPYEIIRVAEESILWEN